MKKGYKRNLSKSWINNLRLAAKRRIGSKHKPETIEKMKISQAKLKPHFSKFFQVKTTQ